MDKCTGIAEDRLVEVSDGVVLLLELVCVADVTAELEDVVKWIELISEVNTTTDNVCDEVGCELKLFDSAGLCRTVADEKAEKLLDEMLVEGNERIDCVECMLKSAETCGLDDADNL